ncbi:MAG: hypothetical protein DPW23_09955 [Gammaproteobacteria bacterium]|nr:hypothetical protein [Gammaproteobacteria bacterium]
MVSKDPPATPFDQAAESVVALGNRMLDQDSSADLWEVASGLLAGAVQFPGVFGYPACVALRGLCYISPPSETQPFSR